MKGRAAILKAHAQPVAIEEFDVPDPEPGCIVLKITQAGVCGSDMHLWRGDMTYPLPPQGSHMGHEGAGVVYKLGKGVTTDSLGAPLHEGDRIVHAAIDPCGRCHLCLEGRTNLCLYKHGNRSKVGEFPYFQGTFADYYYIHANKSVFKVPGEVHYQLLGPVNCAYGTVLQGLTVAQAGHGQSIVFQGAGGLGLIGTAPTRSSSSTGWRTASNSPRSLAPRTRSTSTSTTRRRCAWGACARSPAGGAPTSPSKSWVWPSCSPKGWR